MARAHACDCAGAVTPEGLALWDAPAPAISLQQVPGGLDLWRSGSHQNVPPRNTEPSTAASTAATRAARAPGTVGEALLTQPCDPIGQGQPARSGSQPLSTSRGRP